MTGKGRCLDNIYIERFWRSFKYEEDGITPVYITDGSFTPPSTYGRGTFDASSGKFDSVDQRIELNWKLPPREAAAFNFNVIPHRLNDGTVNLTNSGAPNPNQDIKGVVR